MEINVLVDDNFTGSPGEDWLQNIVKQVLMAENAGSDVEVGLVLTTQEKIQQLNLTYLGMDEPTDVLSFSMLPGSPEDDSGFVLPPDGIKHLGEVLISFPQAVIQAEEHGHSVAREITILIIHGVLHLLGYDHDKPGLEKDMRAREAEILGGIEGEQ